MILRVFLIAIIVLAVLVVGVPFAFNMLGLGFFNFASIGLGHFGADSSSILKSVDYGGSWEEITVSGSKDQSSPQIVFTLEPHPQNSAIIYLGTAGSGLWRSDNGGKSWRKISDKSGVLKPESDVYKIFVAHGDPLILYLAVFQEKRGMVLKSVDGGKNFREIYFTPDGSEVFDIFVDSYDSDRVVILMENGGLFGSRDGGGAWSLLQWLPFSPVGFVVNSSNADEMYIAASSGKVFKTTDSGKTLEEIKVGLDAGVQAEEKPKAGEDLYKQAFDPNLLNDLGDIFGSGSSAIYINPANFYDIITWSREGVFRSLDGGTSWQKIPTIIPSGTKIDAVAMQSAKNSIIIIAGGEVYRTDDSGASWKISVIPGRPEVRELTMHPLKPEVIFAILGK